MDRFVPSPDSLIGDPLARKFSLLLPNIQTPCPPRGDVPDNASFVVLHEERTNESESNPDSSHSLNLGFLNETREKRHLILILSILCIHVEPLLPCPNSESYMDAQDRQD